jgi:hypothetical protein
MRRAGLLACSMALGAYLAGSALAQTPEWRPTLISIPGIRAGNFADVDRDGRLDIVVHNYFANREIAIHLGRGGVRFPATPSLVINLPYEAAGIALADVNNHGRIDIGVGSYDDAGEYAQMMLGDGQGGFAPLPRFTTASKPQYYKGGFRFGDFNEDGNADLLVVNGRRADMRVMFGDGKGGFVDGTRFTLDYTPHRFFLGVADVNGDKHLDLVAPGNAGAERPRLLVKLGDGNGAFRTIQDSTLDIEAAPRTKLADLDSDGDLDLLLSHIQGLSILLNDGKGQFAPSSLSPGPQPKPAFDTEVLDLNSDGRADIAMAGEDAVVVLLGTSAGFVPARGSPFRVGPGAYSLRVLDLNGDGQPDIVSNAFGNDSKGVLLGG